MSSPPKESSSPSLLHQLLHKQRDLTNEPVDLPRTEASKAAPLPSKLPFDIPGEYADYMLPPVYKTLTRFKVYESSHKIYIIGGTPDGSEYRILKIDRFPTDPEILPIEEDPAVYDQEELDSALEMLGYSLESTGGLTLLASGVAILGCIKFLYGYYLHMVTASHVVARIGAHAVHAIDDTTFIQLWNPQAFTDIATNVVTPAQLQEAGARHALAQGSAASGDVPLRPAHTSTTHADAPGTTDVSHAPLVSVSPEAGSYTAAACSRRSRSRPRAGAHGASRDSPAPRAASRSSSASDDDSLARASNPSAAASPLSVAVRQPARPRGSDNDVDSSDDSYADECDAVVPRSPSSGSSASARASPGHAAAYESIGAAVSPRHSAAHPHRGALGGMSPSLWRAGEETEDDAGSAAHVDHGRDTAVSAPAAGAAVPPVLGGAAHPRIRALPLRNTGAFPAHVSHFRPKKCRSQETKYRSLYLMLELTKGDHYFSYTYPLSHRMQNIIAHSLQLQRLHSTHQALLRAQAEAAGEPFTPTPLSELYTPMPPLSHFAWNNHHLGPLAAQLPAPALAQWAVVLVHGYIEQAAVPVYTRSLSLTLIARRAKQFAGTRYLKRGISQCGDAANEIEVEQLLHDAFAGHHREGQYASHVQVRASIPLFWTQEGNAMVAKPDITVTNPDLMSMGTRTHIASMLQRYGAPLVLLNLIKQEERRPRETVVGGLFSDAMGMLNSFLPSTYALHYLPWDYKRVAKSADVSILDELAVIAQWSLHKTGLFHTHPRPEAIAAQYTACSEPLTPHRQSLQEYEQRLLGAFHHQHIGFVQRGVVRSNCIDSLDRTNVAQFCVGKLALAYQLYTLGVLGAPLISHNTGLLALLLEMYERMGDAVALQYGGSQMHRQMKKDGNKSHIMAPVLYRQTQHLTKPKEIYVSLIRHYQNSFQDKVKQDAINVFLGKFAPSVHLTAASSASNILDSIRGLRARAPPTLADSAGSHASGVLPSGADTGVNTPPRVAHTPPRAPTTVSGAGQSAQSVQSLFADAADVPIWEQESDYYQHNPPPDATATYLGQVCFGNHRWWAFPLALFEALLPWGDFVADKVVHVMAKVFLPDYPAYDPLLAAGYRGTDAYALHCVCACHQDALSPLQCLCDCPKHGAARRRRVSPAAAALALLPHWAPPLEQWQAHALMFAAALDEACQAASEAGLLLDEDTSSTTSSATSSATSSFPCTFERAQPTLAQPPSAADIAAAVVPSQPLPVEVYHVPTELSRVTAFTPSVAAQLASLVHPRHSSYTALRHAYRHGRRRCVAAAALPSPVRATASSLNSTNRPARVPPLPLPLRLGVVSLAPLAKYSAAAPTLLDDVAAKADAGSSLLVEDRDDSEAAPVSDEYVDALAHTSSHEACMQALPLLPLLRACALMGTPSVAAALLQMAREERVRADAQGSARTAAAPAVFAEEKHEAEEAKAQGVRASKVKSAAKRKHAHAESASVALADQPTATPGVTAPAAGPSTASVSGTTAASPGGSPAHTLDLPDAAPVCSHVVSLVREAVAAITRSGVLSREAELAFDAMHNTQYRHERVMWGAVDADDDATAVRARVGAREAWSGAETVYSAKHMLLARGGQAMSEQGRAVTLAECAEGRADVKVGAYVAGSAGRNAFARADWCSSPGPRWGRAGLHPTPYQFRLQQPLWAAADDIPSTTVPTSKSKGAAGGARDNASLHAATATTEPPQASHAVYVPPPPPAPAGVVSVVLQALQTLPYVATTPLARLLKVCLPPAKELPAASRFVVDPLALHVAEYMIHSTDPYLPEPKTDHVLTALLANAFTPAASPIYPPNAASPLPLPTFASKLPTASLHPPRPAIAQFSSIPPNTPVPLSMPLAPADLWSPLAVALRVERLPVDGSVVYAPLKPSLFAPTPGDEGPNSSGTSAPMEESKDQPRAFHSSMPTSPSPPQPTAVLQPFPDAAALPPTLRRQLRAALQQYCATSSSLHGESVTVAGAALSDEDVYASQARWERQRAYVPVSASTVLNNLGVARSDADDDGELMHAAGAPPRGPDVVEVSRADVPSVRASRVSAPLVSRKVAPNKTPNAAARAGHAEPVQYGVGRAVVVSGVADVVSVGAVRGVVVGEDAEYAYVEVEVSDDEDNEESTDTARELPMPAALHVHTDTETMDLSTFETDTPSVAHTSSSTSTAPQSTQPSFCLPAPISASLPALPAPLRTLPDLAVHVPKGVRGYCDDWRFSEQQWGDIFTMSREDAPAPVELQTDTSTFDRYLRYL